MENTLFNPKENSFLTILMGALLLGFAWQIRGSGTSDPAVVSLLFLLFLSINYSPRKKFNLLDFGLITFFIGITRTGWGTFVSQGGIPGIEIPKAAVINYVVEGVAGYKEFPVDWYMGYFWMFIVGISWFGVPSLLFGGYLFTKLKYSIKDLLILFVIFIVSWYLVSFLVELFMVPHIVPDYYNNLYLAEVPGNSKRSFGSMVGNMSRAMAIVPVLLYIRYIKKDKIFFKNALIAILIFASSIAIADVFWPLGQLLGMGGIASWSLWEYFTGFFFGGLIFWFYGRFSDKVLVETNTATGMDFFTRNSIVKFLSYSLALYVFVFQGIGESLEGGISKAFSAFGIDFKPSASILKIIISSIGLSLYFIYFKGIIGNKIAKNSFREKSFIALIILLPFYYLNFALHQIITGELFNFHRDNSAVWLDTISFVIVEIYIIYLYRRYKKSSQQFNYLFKSEKKQ